MSPQNKHVSYGSTQVKDTFDTCQKEVVYFEKYFDLPTEPEPFSGRVTLRKAMHLKYMGIFDLPLQQNGLGENKYLQYNWEMKRFFVDNLMTSINH